MKEKRMKKAVEMQSNNKTKSSEKGITDIQKILPRYDDRFYYPLIESFVMKHNPKDAILRSCEIINGLYGETAIVYFENPLIEGEIIGYRCTSKTFIDQVKILIDAGTFPLKVHVGAIYGNESKYPYYILNAHADDFLPKEKKEMKAKK